MSRCLSLVYVFAAVATGAPSLAVASVEPLLVVVETRPGGVVDPVEVRQAIATELGIPVRAPRDAAAEETSNLLIVAVDHGEIRMSLRARAASVVSRAVPAPGDRKARLQSIGWLAGNLARDQVGAIVVPMPAPVSGSAASVEMEPTSRPEVPPPAPAPRSATDPPPFAENAERQTAGASGGVVSTRPSPADADGTGPAWSLTLAGGPTAALLQVTQDHREQLWPGPGVYHLELQRRASSDSLILGAALEVGPDMAFGLRGPSIDWIGAAALVGVGRRFRRTFVEATTGLGLEAYQSTMTVETLTSSATGVTSVSRSVTTPILGLYVRGQATAGVSLSKSFDLLASIGGHLGTVGRRDAFLSTSLGVRLRFP